MQLFLEQKGIGAEIDVFLPRDEALDDLIDCGCIRGSPPGMETIGVPPFVTALNTLPGSNLFQDVRGVLILPQPAQARLQRNSGSNIKKRTDSAFGPSAFA